MGNYTRSNDKLTGSQLKFRDYRASINYKDYHVPNGKLIDDKEYDIIIHESEDSEGWCYTRYEITGEHPELDKMIEDVKLEEAVRNEIDKREKEYFDKLREKYQNMSHEKLVNEMIVLQQRLKNLFFSSSFYYG